MVLRPDADNDDIIKILIDFEHKLVATTTFAAVKYDGSPLPPSPALWTLPDNICSHRLRFFFFLPQKLTTLRRWLQVNSILKRGS